MEKAKRGAARLGDRRSRTFLSALLSALLFALLSTALLLLLSALLLSRSGDPTRLALPIGIGIAAVAAFLGGFRAGQLRRTSGALMGLSEGMLLVFSYLLVSLILTEGRLPLLSMALYCAVFLLSLFGGMLATGRRSRRRGHR